MIYPVGPRARKGVISRETAETTVRVSIDLDGRGLWEISTGLRFFDHLLSQLARHGLFDIIISATGADQHHVVEDVAICLGRALDQALGDKRGLVRMGHAIVPMDDALAVVATDLSGRGYAVVEVPLAPEVGGLPADLVRHFFYSFATEGRFNLHAHIYKGINDHHKTEALFKALARALKRATRMEERLQGESPSTKGIID